jgi:hypothetical protein
MQSQFLMLQSQNQQFGQQNLFPGGMGRGNSMAGLPLGAIPQFLSGGGMSNMPLTLPVGAGGPFGFGSMPSGSRSVSATGSSGTGTLPLAQLKRGVDDDDDVAFADAGEGENAELKKPKRALSAYNYFL